MLSSTAPIVTVYVFALGLLTVKTIIEHMHNNTITIIIKLNLPFLYQQNDNII